MEKYFKVKEEILIEKYDDRNAELEHTILHSYETTLNLKKFLYLLDEYSLDNTICIDCFKFREFLLDDNQKEFVFFDLASNYDIGVTNTKNYLYSIEQKSNFILEICTKRRITITKVKEE